MVQVILDVSDMEARLIADVLANAESASRRIRTDHNHPLQRAYKALNDIGDAIYEGIDNCAEIVAISSKLELEMSA